jgi:hypothetical protein
LRLAIPEGSDFDGAGVQRIADASGSVSVRLRVTENDGSVGNANSTVRVSEGYG